jgi:multidrug efflux pump subunit AcrA (membrane-fusion protein)
MPEIEESFSNEVAEIISNKPVWIVRNGIALFFVIIGLIFSMTFFIQYPDILKAPVRIIGNNIPKQLISKTEGKLVEIIAKDNSHVEQGDLLAILQSNADYKQALELEQWILNTENRLKNKQWSEINNISSFNNLGELQKSYLELQQQLYQLNLSIPHGYFDQKTQAIEKDLSIINDLKLNSELQKKLIQQDLDMQQNLLKTNEGLVHEKVLAALELNKDKAMVISKKQQLIQVDAGNISQAASALGKEKELLEMKKSKLDIQQNFITALYNTKTAIAEWKNKYLIVATESGKLQYASYFQENSWIKAGQELFFIIPNQPTYFAEMLASQQNFGKISEGQLVNIALNSYQRNEFGIIKGVIKNIPAFPTKDSIFVIRVQLINGLTTNYNKQLHFSNNLTGVAEIITANVCLADRLLYQWRGIFQR